MKHISSARITKVKRVFPFPYHDDLYISNAKFLFYQLLKTDMSIPNSEKL